MLQQVQVHHLEVLEQNEIVDQKREEDADNSEGSMAVVPEKVAAARYESQLTQNERNLTPTQQYSHEWVGLCGRTQSPPHQRQHSIGEVEHNRRCDDQP